MRAKSCGECLMRRWASTGRGRWHGKAAVVVGPKGLQPRIGGDQGGEPVEAQFFHQVVLQGLMRLLDPAFGLRDMHMDRRNVQGLQRPGELGARTTASTCSHKAGVKAFGGMLAGPPQLDTRGLRGSVE